jgi:hypothetical protein
MFIGVSSSPDEGVALSWLSLVARVGVEALMELAEMGEAGS